MDAVKFFEEFNIKHHELQNGESVQHYASRVLIGHSAGGLNASPESFSVHYSYGSIAQEAVSDNNSDTHTLYTY
ncbi:hypothetical protein G5574_06330 [Pantoea stewartii]|uniref:hypothetical protein n=1 Tax=Pantoea stewartii TaxID=66269 RepID=UPI0013DD9DE4|nr:hypothetical protein [Pantoea stewartii]QIE96603.1 hypothetical protein G5574_06330 [Pantoea stewartii]